MQLHLIDDLWEPTGTLDVIFLAVWGVILIAMAALGLVNLVKFRKRKQLLNHSLLVLACGGTALSISILADHISKSIF